MLTTSPLLLDSIESISAIGLNQNNKKLVFEISISKISKDKCFYSLELYIYIYIYIDKYMLFMSYIFYMFCILLGPTQPNQFRTFTTFSKKKILANMGGFLFRSVTDATARQGCKCSLPLGKWPGGGPVSHMTKGRCPSSYNITGGLRPNVCCTHNTSPHGITTTRLVALTTNGKKKKKLNRIKSIKNQSIYIYIII